MSAHPAFGDRTRSRSALPDGGGRIRGIRTSGGWLALALIVCGLTGWGEPRATEPKPGGSPTTPPHPDAPRPWSSPAATPAQRAAMLLSMMSQDDKIQLVHGVHQTYATNVPGNPALGIPELHLEDSAWGVAQSSAPVTQFPAPITMASNWDTALATQYGTAIGAEEYGTGTNVMLGPTMNIDRVPQGGRVCESYGEDPYLSAQVAAALVTGAQSQYVVTTIKHYIDNDQENNRNGVNVVIDDRTQHEIYLPPFAAGVKAGSGAVMCSYNSVNGDTACANDATLNGLLKQELGFTGWVLSDWGANPGTTSCLRGLDMDTPGDPSSSSFAQPLADAISSGQVPQSRLDDMVTRILTSMFAVGLFDHPTAGTQSTDVTSQAHSQLASDTAAGGLVLLANDGILPLSGSTVKTIAVIGSSADANVPTSGGGASGPGPSNLVTPLQGIKNRAGPGITVNSAADDLTTGPSIAGAADVAVVVVSTSSYEGGDRSDLTLEGGSTGAMNQDQLVAAVLAAQPKTIVVTYSPAQILMPWAGQAAALLWGGLGGEQIGDGLARVLFGDVNPSGRLPFVVANQASDYPAQTQDQYPGGDNGEFYSEGPFIGYRYLDDLGIKPQFPFGHGLSYTKFDYANLGVGPNVLAQPTGHVTVTADITNSGRTAGAEVAQLYVGFPAEASEPPWQLKGFQKVNLMPGAKQAVTFTLDPSAYSFWSTGLKSWVSYPGNYLVNVGASETDIRLTGAFQVHGGPLDGTVVQAETGALSGGASVERSHRHSTGTGYVTMSGSGATDTIMVDAPTAGAFSVVVRYSANDPKNPASVSVSANGGSLSTISCPWVANLDMWDFAAAMVQLNAGTNTLTIASSTGAVNLDAVTVAGDGMIDAGTLAEGGGGSTSSGSAGTSTGGSSGNGASGGTSNGGSNGSTGGSATSSGGGTGSTGSSGNGESSGNASSSDGGSGCGCTTAGRSSTSGKPLLVLLPALAVIRRRPVTKKGPPGLPTTNPLSTHPRSAQVWPRGSSLATKATRGPIATGPPFG